QPFHQGDWFYSWVLNLATVLTLNNGAFLLRGFRLVFEHREEPRRTTLSAVANVAGVFLPCACVNLVGGLASIAVPAYMGAVFCDPALFVHFCCRVFI